jgi:anti-anti-sigma factor
MDLTLKSRFAGNVYIIECSGRIVLGPETKALEAELDANSYEFRQFVLNLRELTRLDSIGVGLIARYAERLRKRGGDIRLASPPQFLVHLLQLTRLSDTLISYPTEEEAILTFLRQPRVDDEKPKPGCRVLFVDESADLGVFVRTILRKHGFDVRASCLLRDAKVLLQADTVDYILAGPGSASRPADTVLSTLIPLAPKAIALRLDDDFKSRDAGEATDSLLRIFKVEGSASCP